MNRYRTHIIQIGNSKGIRIPKVFLSFLGTEKVELECNSEGILIRPLSASAIPRSQWTKVLSTMMIDKKEDDLKDWDITSNDGLKDF